MNRYYQLLIILVLFIVSISAYFLVDDLRVIISRGTQIDSIGHLTSFFLLTWLLNGIAKFPLINCMLTLSFYAALTELGQYYLGFRNGEISDFFADLVGIALFSILRWGFIIYRQNKLP
ncbi:VanZ family protein [Thalassotalea piscium]